MKLKRGQLIACSALGVLAVVVAIAGLLAVVAPQRSQAAKLNDEITKTEAKLISLHGHGRGPVIRAAELFQLARAMPDNADMPGIVLGLARAANASSVTLVSIQPGVVVPQPDGAGALPVHVIVDGRWGGVTSFLRALRTAVMVHSGKLTASDRLFVVDSVQMVAGTGTSEVEATISANAFSYGVAPPPVPTDTTSTTTTTTTTTTAGSVQAAGATGSAG
jgi:Tfp pilus assembly protein PilO